MPRVTRRSLASKKEEDAAQPTQSGGRRGSKRTEPVVEPEPIGEPALSKTGRRGKGTAVAKEEPPKGRTTSRGRGKKDEEPEVEEVDEEEIPAPKRGKGRGKKEEKIEEAPTPKKATRGSQGKKEEEPEEEDEEEMEELPPPKKTARGGRGKKEEEATASKRASSRGGRAKKEEIEEASTPEEEEATPSKQASSRSGRAKKEEVEEASTPEKEEEVTPSKRASSRGGRAKKGEVEEASTPEKSSPRGRGRLARGARNAQPEEEEESDTKGSQKETPSGGRRGRGKKESVSPAAPAEVEAEPEKEAEESKIEKEKSEDSSKVLEDAPETMDTESKEKTAKDEKEEMEVEGEETSEADAAAVEKPSLEETTQAEVGKKRKLEDEEEESSSKKARIVEPVETDGSKDEDYVIVNKEDVPAADSKEVEAALPPPVENEKQVPEEMESADTTSPTDDTPPKMVAPVSVVPLTEAELAKQYNPTFRDRDDNSSMMVEVGSEAASDVGSVSRNLDISEMAAIDQAGQDDSITSSDVSEALSSSSKPMESTTTPPVSNNVSVPAAAPEPTPPVVAQTTSDVEMASIPLPQQQTEAHPPPPTAPFQLTPAPPAVVAPSPNPQPANTPEVQVNSIPMPPNYNTNSSSDHATTVPSQQPISSSIPPVQPAQNATAQNGSYKPCEQVAQSLPLHTSTPAKKPITIDGSYIPSSSSITQRKFISNRSFPIELMDPAFCFSVVSYNILADCHLRRYNYSYTEAQFLDLSYRHTLFLKELDYLDGDIVCLQEVDTKYYSDVLLPAMTSRGYQGMFKKRTQDWYDEGEATFVKTSKFEVLSYDGISLRDLAYEEIAAASLTGDVSRAAKKYLDRADVVLVCKLLSKRTGKQLTVGNIHVLYDPKARDVQCVQVASAVKELVSKAGSDLNPYIICGDFNSETTSPAYQLAKDGYLNDEHIRVLQNIQSMDNTEGSSNSIIHYLWKAFQHTSSNMKSAYETSVGREPVITSLNSITKSCLDYIFYSSSTLYTVGAMEVIDPQVIEATGGLPTKDIPSDHLSVKAVFRLKD